MSANRGLGRGLDALLGGSVEEEEAVNSSEVSTVVISAIIPNPNQPRQVFSDEALDDLASSIKSQGVLQPILVRPMGEGRYELVAGERRLRASKLAGLTEIPALVREMTDQESLAIALIENLQREDLNAIEEALGYKQLIDQFGLSQEELAKSMGKSRSALANSLRLLNLPAKIQNDIREGIITAGHGRAIMAVADEKVAIELHERIVGKGLSVRQAEAQAGYYKKEGELPGEEEPQTPVFEKSTGSTGATIKKTLDPYLEQLQDRLVDSFGLKITVSGSLDRGKIVFQYANAEEFTSLTDMLGIGSE